MGKWSTFVDTGEAKSLVSKVVRQAGSVEANDKAKELLVSGTSMLREARRTGRGQEALRLGLQMLDAHGDSVLEAIAGQNIDELVDWGGTLARYVLYDSLVSSIICIYACHDTFVSVSAIAH